MPRRYMVQVEEDSVYPAQSPASVVSSPVPLAPSVSANNSSLPPRRRGVFVEAEEDPVPQSISKRRQSVQLETDLPDFVTQRQQELNKIWQEERLLQAQAEAASVTREIQTPRSPRTPQPERVGESQIVGQSQVAGQLQTVGQFQTRTQSETRSGPQEVNQFQGNKQPQTAKQSQTLEQFPTTKQLPTIEQSPTTKQLPTTSGEPPGNQAPETAREGSPPDSQKVFPPITTAPAGTPGRLDTTQRLDKIEGFYRRQQGAPPKKPSSVSRWRNWGKRVVRSKLLIAGFMVLFLLASTLISGYLIVRADYQTVQSESAALIEDFQNGRFTSARERVQVLTQKEQRYRSLYQTSRPLVSLVQGDERTAHLDQVFMLSEKGIQLVVEGLNLSSDVELAYHQFTGSDQGNTLETAARISGELEGLYSELATFQAEIQRLQNPYEVEAITEVKRVVTAELPQIRRSTLTAQKISQVIPSLLAKGEEKKYLVLLQNNAELRPTGGFIGSYALVRIRDGKLQEFSVEDVYEADGQLQGYVTPPEEIVQYLGEAQWFLRDVNWSPDFPKVAQRAAWFLDKTINTKVDGVIAINLSMVQKLLAVTGPLELVDYGEVITQNNLYESAETHSELNFFPGSTQKKDFLSAVSQQLLDKVFYQPTNKGAIAQALLDSAEEAEFFMSVTDPQVEEVLKTLGWNGALLSPNCPAPFAGENCVVDTVMQVEANVGVNKANQHLSRSIKHEVELMNDVARHTRSMTFTNAAQTTAWPSGDYKTYLRLFVPLGSQLRSAELDGQPLDLTRFKSPEEDGKQVFGYYLEVPIKSSKTLKVFYETPLLPGYKTYALFEQKQSGVWNNEIVHRIAVGQKNVVTVAPEPSQIDGRTLEFTSKSLKHEFFAVDLE